MATFTDSIRKDRVRLMGFLKKPDSITDNEFMAGWHAYAQKFKELDIVRENILKYEQTYVNEDILKMLESLGMSPLGFKAAAVLEGESYEKIFGAMKSEEYAQNMSHLQAGFVESVQWFPIDIVTVVGK
ncbi:hypothetical protein C8J57DRAFT_1295697 [Mycena rebaudengoi]|nr:hypothetical protein C8J57DRAFT_1295697 [Mycena rebaudengoi]